MTGHYGPEEWWYPDGTSAANVRAAVFEGDQSTLASIFSDSALTIPLANPTTTDGSGMLEFYVVDGDYWIFVGDENYGDSVLAVLSPPVTGTGGALLISNNLSDLSNVVTARTNLGLGTAALADTGVNPTNVILGNDARLTNARTPLAHAATHGALGTDPVTIEESQVTGLTADLASKQPIDTDLTAIAALTPANDDIIQRKAGVWTNRTVAQYKTDLAITSADVGAQPIATIDAKGDLYAGTGNDATTRLPVGINGEVLRANSATGTGLEWDTLTAGDVGADPAGSAAAAQAASQPLDSDLTAIAALAPPDDDVIQRKAGAWVARTPAQLKTDLAITASDVGAVPTSRILTAGIALSGGGDLTADRTFDVDLGTTAGTAAEGNDSRITGAQQRSALTTKGDLYVATAASTTTRQGVGTDGFALVSDSTLTNGIDWKVRASVGIYPRSTGYSPAGMIGTTRSSKAATANTMFLTPVYILVGATLTSIAFEVSGNVANAVARLGIYGSSATMLPTGAAIADYGTTTADTTTTKTVAVSTLLAPGLYWVAIVGQTASPTLRFSAGQSPWVANATFPAGSGVGWNNALAQTGVSGTLPSIGTIVDSDAPLIGLKF